MVAAPLPEGAGALDGIRVLDLSRVLAGPLCAQMLADHGAEVVKLEGPAGDDTRRWGPPFRNGSAAYFDGLNRGKRNVSADLSTEAGRRTLTALFEWADVVVENFRQGTMESWGLRRDDVLEAHPQVVWCRITGYGDDGPLGGRPGYDAVLQAHSGLMSVNGYPDSPPLRMGVPIVDIVAGNQAFAGVLLALLARERIGRGQIVDIALFDAALSLLHPHSANWLEGGVVPQRTGDRHPSVVPYQTFQAADGLVFIGAANDRAFGRLCVELGCEELIADERFRGNGDRLVHANALTMELESRIQRRAADELTGRLLEVGVAAAALYDVAAALNHPHALHRRMVVDLDGRKVVGQPIKLERTPGLVRLPSRPRGADTAEVLARLETLGEDATVPTQDTDEGGAVIAGP